MTDATTPIEARRALVQQIAQQALDLCRAHARDGVDEAATLDVLKAWLSDFARDTSEIRERWKLAEETRTGADLIAALQASPCRYIDIASERNIGGDESDDLPTPPLFGEDYYAATILDIVYRHCKAEDGLDSRGDRLRAELMMLCEEDGLIEIVDQFGWFITANLTPDGLTTLADLAEQEFQEWAREQKDGNKPLVPNKETIEAMKAAERGEVTTVGHPRELLKSLNASHRDEP